MRKLSRTNNSINLDTIALALGGDNTTVTAFRIAE
jgi:hypothetical protein